MPLATDILLYTFVTQLITESNDHLDAQMASLIESDSGTESDSESEWRWMSGTMSRHPQQCLSSGSPRVYSSRYLQ